MLRGAELYDDRPSPEATAEFLEKHDHHLFNAYDEIDEPVGVISGLETTHPQKGTDMFL